MQAGSVMDHLAGAVAVASEEALVAELRAGSERAFAELIAQYHQPLYSLIARSLQDPADASDITQEVFIKVFRNIRSFHGDASLRTWLYRIALHEASNQRRWWSRHKRQEVAIEAPYCSHCDADAGGEAQSLGATLADGGCSPFDCAAQQEVRERVEAALRQVPEAFRTAVVLREIEGFTYEEIADILRVNLGTVKSRLTRGRAVLRGLLAPEKATPAGAQEAAPHRAATPAAASASDHISAAAHSPQAYGSRQRTHAGPVPGSGAESLAEVSR
jgi:RNA polymerase sigma-70 factor (ECF subfamily)